MVSNESELNAQLVTMYSQNKTNEYTHLLVFCVVLETAKPLRDDLDDGPIQVSLSGDSLDSVPVILLPVTTVISHS